MKYEEFRKTDYYKKSQAAITIFRHLYYFSVIPLFLSPFWGYLIKGTTGFYLGLFAIVVSVSFWADIFKERFEIDIKGFIRSWMIVSRTQIFWYPFLGIWNLYVFFFHTLNTQLTLPLMAIGLVIFYLVSGATFLIKISFLKKLTKVSFFIFLIPSLFNFFFSINYTFSSNPVVEKYSFAHRYQNIRGRSVKTTSIDLEGKQYEAYPHFRRFLNYEKMAYAHQITYIFEDGLLGLRVLKNYKFDD
jgi:hypothetical protein